MGLETAPQRAVNVPAGPLVTPADSNMLAAGQRVGDAFRSGFITANEVVERLGERQRQKEKMEVDLAKLGQMQAQEAMTPEAQALRQQVQSAEAARAAAATMTANELVSPAAQAARSQSLAMNTLQDQIKFEDLKRGGAISQYMALAPNFSGLSVPKKADGTPDFDKMEQMVPDLKIQAQTMADALEMTKPDKMVKVTLDIDPNDPNKGGAEAEIRANKVGQPLTTSYLNMQKARLEGARNFFRTTAPGTATTTPSSPAASALVTPGPTPEQTALAGKLRAQRMMAGDTNAADLNLPDVEYLKKFGPIAPPTSNVTVESAAPSGQAKPAAAFQGMVPGTVNAEGYLITKTIPPGQAVKAPTEAQQRAGAAESRMIKGEEVIQNLKQQGFDPGSFSNMVQNWFVGPLNFFKTRENQEWTQAQNGWVTGLLRMESGAAISTHEERWYRNTFFAQPGDSPEVQAQKEESRKAVQSVVHELAAGGNLDVPKLIQIQKDAEARVAPSQTYAPGKNPFLSNPATAKTPGSQSKFTDPRGVNWIIQYGPDGKPARYLKAP